MHVLPEFAKASPSSFSRVPHQNTLMTVKTWKKLHRNKARNQHNNIDSSLLTN